MGPDSNVRKGILTYNHIQVPATPPNSPTVPASSPEKILPRIKALDICPPKLSDTPSHHSGPSTRVVSALEELQASETQTQESLLEYVRELRSEPIHPLIFGELRKNFSTPQEVNLLKNMLSEADFAKFQGERASRRPSHPGTFLGKTMLRRVPQGRPHLRGPLLAGSFYQSGPPLEMPSEESCPTLECSRCNSKKHDDECCNLPLVAFKRFKELPSEVRMVIYGHALHTDGIIRPHLCDEEVGTIKFHDRSQHSWREPNHSAISKLLGITQVSKAIRAESLPCFYSTNTFDISADTSAYFMYLKSLGRFHMIRNVHFCINMRNSFRAGLTLQQLHHHDLEVKSYEQTFGDRSPTHSILANHPNYIAGGLHDMNLFICLRLLASTFTDLSPNSCTSKLVLAVPSAQIFTRLRSLQWFPTVCYGLGIHLCFNEGEPLHYSDDLGIGVTWHQREQKKDFEEGKADAVDVRGRALQQFPELDSMEHRVRETYMRASCDGHSYKWFDVRHA